MCQQNNNTKSKKGKHLEYSERQSIERWFNRDKRTKVEIAELLDRTEKTIRNEIKRGLVKNLTTELIEIWVYSADVAQQKYEYYLRAKGPKLKIDNDYELKEYVEKSIKEDRKSPEVIAKEIKKMNFKTKMCARTIRNNIYAGDIYNIKSTDMIYNKEYKDKNKEKTVCEKVPPEKSIDYRPEEANTREEYGHWELDCVEGSKDSKKTYMTLLERMTKKYIVVEMKEHTNECIKNAIDSLEEKYGSKFKKIFKSMTTDNGHEFLNYDKIEISKFNENEKRTVVYYADPYSSWQKGMNENCNGILRRFIPKGTDLNKVSSDKLEKILNKINGKPRKILGFISADKRFKEEIEKIVA